MRSIDNFFCKKHYLLLPTVCDSTDDMIESESKSMLTRVESKNGMIYMVSSRNTPGHKWRNVFIFYESKMRI